LISILLSFLFVRTIIASSVSGAHLFASSGGSAGIVIGIVVALAVILVATSTIVARRRGYSGMGGNTIVRCRQGHLFTTIWVPGASLKAVRLGTARWQRCPVGKHWSLVTPLKDSDLTDEDREIAAQHHDVKIP